MERRPEDGVDGARPLLRFDDFLVDPGARLLLRNGEPVPLTPKVFAVLLALLEKPAQLIPKEELIRKVWPDSFVTEANLTQSISTLRKALGEKANDRRYVVTIPGQGYSFVAPLTEVAAAPLSSASPLFPAPLPSPPAPGPPPRRQTRRRFEALSVALILAVAVAWIALVRPARAPAPDVAARPGGQRHSIAVLGFRNLSGRSESQWLAAAIPEMLTTELAAAKQVRVIPGNNVARARLPTDPLDGPALEHIHEVLGSDLLVVGSYLPLGEKAGRRLRLDVRVLRLPGGEPLVSLAEVGTEPELFELVSRTGSRLREALGVAVPSSQQARLARALLPASPEAARLYSEGLARQRSFDPSGALGLLERAAKADPGSAVIRSALSQAWAELGNDARALEEARRAVDLARSLPRTERLATQARLHVVSKEWNRASEIYRSLWTFYPDDLEYGLQLAASQAEAGRSTEALATVAALRRLPAPAGDDPRIDLAEADAARRLADLGTLKRAAEAAVAKAKDTGSELVAAQALLLQGEALVRMGRAAQAIPLFFQAGERFEAAGDQMSLLNTLTLVGVALREQGQLDGAEAHFREALAIAERLGSPSGIALQRANLGIIHQYRGELRQARESLELARSLYAQVGDRMLESRTLYTLALVLWAQGDLADARTAFDRVLELTRATGNRRDEARALGSAGMTLARQGRLAEARRRHEQAFAMLQETGDSSLAAAALADSAGVLIRQGALPAARQRLDQALATKRRVRDRIGAAEVLDSLAGLALASGDLATAARLVEEQLRTAKELEVRALTVKGLRRRAALQRARGNLEAARSSLGEALQAALQTGEELQAVDLRLDLASLSLAQDRLEEAGRLARETAAWYATRDLRETEGRALALLAEALSRQGKTAEARETASRARGRLEGTEDVELRGILRGL
ncbi:MAG TPA: tetratricopeptide repeat protein [Thermoanaerobaculia bacterium]|nr:tetratricopeptide repeat protein [Thermoanaerobaculia bacterium]